MNGLAFYLLIDLCANTGLNELILASLNIFYCSL